MSGSRPATPAHCRNCGAPLAGHYCSQCGQAADVHVPTTHELVHEVLEGLTHSDSRLCRTLLALWFRPGLLTIEYVRGRRVAYLPPFRLYLVVSVVFFLLALSGDSDLQLISVDIGNGRATVDTGHALAESDCQQISLFRESHPDWYERIQHGCVAASRDSGHSWKHGALTLLPKAMFCFVPLVALLHMALYWWPRHRYAEHLVFFLHLHAFFFSVLTLVGLMSRFGARLPSLHWIAALCVPLLQLYALGYALLALRRVFDNGWPLTLLKAIALLVGYSVLLALTLSAVYMYAALQL